MRSLGDGFKSFNEALHIRTYKPATHLIRVNEANSHEMFILRYNFINMFFYITIKHMYIYITCRHLIEKVIISNENIFKSV